MAKSFNWDGRIGRRVRLRDLHILFAVAQHHSMARAAEHLGMSQSAVSQAVAALEHAIGAPLLDRMPRGVELTTYGTALMRRGQAAFDELRSGIKDIEVLADPNVGEVRIACTEAIAAGVLPAILERFSLRYPRVALHVFQTSNRQMGYAALQERKADVALTLSVASFEHELAEQLQGEVLFNERICLAAARQSHWARRRKIDFADLADAELISPPSSDTPGGTALMEAFRKAGLPTPQITVTTFSIHVRNILCMRGRFIALLPASLLRFNPELYSLKELPLDLPMPRSPVLIVVLKNRTLSPPVERFIECAREITSAIDAPASHKSKTMRSRGIASSKVGA
jgi:DNA-binding transcriptional LysR family regulator